MLESGGDEERAIRAFLDPPTYNRNFEHSFGTLYTAVYAAVGALHRLPLAGGLWRQIVDGFSAGRAHRRAA